ncbi:hypothetical protein E3N88_18274 [Mikania micrantha]|uniref:Uncharacterized protein n=1 Tax=Mikania micrantha TaxID=192012 RepID=A0A5N6NWY6_9ASTR|nr:hypothetical protein E3N88_18274 [Mikania micrantha]
MEVGEHIMNLAKMLIENQKASNDMEACMTKLGTMGWDESDAKYQTTLLLFGESADIRKYDENSMFAETQPQGEPSEGHSILDIEWGSQSNEYMNSLRDHIASHLA